MTGRAGRPPRPNFFGKWFTRQWCLRWTTTIVGELTIGSAGLVAFVLFNNLHHLSFPTPVLPLWLGDNNRLFIAVDGWSLSLVNMRRFTATELVAADAWNWPWPQKRFRSSRCLAFVYGRGDAGLFGMPYQPSDNGLQSADHFVSVGVPAIPILLGMVVGPILIWRRQFVASRSNNPALCLQCGYDLRATPGRCPECGAVPGPA